MFAYMITCKSSYKTFLIACLACMDRHGPYIMSTICETWAMWVGELVKRYGLISCKYAHSYKYIVFWLKWLWQLIAYCKWRLVTCGVWLLLCLSLRSGNAPWCVFSVSKIVSAGSTPNLHSCAFAKPEMKHTHIPVAEPLFRTCQ